MVIADPSSWKENAFQNKGPKYDKIVELIAALNKLIEAPVSGSYSGITTSFTNGEAGSLSFGDFVYVSAAETVKLADANGTLTYPCIGMTVETIATTATGKILLLGVVYNTAWNWTVGAGINNTLYLSTTAGDVQISPPSLTTEKVQVVGQIIHADKILLSPSLDVLEVV